jgi:predicted translin family RNA/ssDNA-binding protein
VVTRLTDDQIRRIGDLLKIMDELKSDISAEKFGSPERTKLWRKYEVARKEVEQIFPPTS